MHGRAVDADAGGDPRRAKKHSARRGREACRLLVVCCHARHGRGWCRLVLQLVALVRRRRVRNFCVSTHQRRTCIHPRGSVVLLLALQLSSRWHTELRSWSWPDLATAVGGLWLIVAGGQRPIGWLGGANGRSPDIYVEKVDSKDENARWTSRTEPSLVR